MGTSLRLTWLVSASAALLAGAAHAQQPPSPSPPPAPAEAEEDDGSNDIVVLAPRGDEIRIDRRTYTL
ncbi:MAG: hypothetical protein K2X34_09980, partial [Hyphomonadaceae bacterium]|nr:hypothetical protein [Hyphomonadaceae bacterium]